MGKRTVRAVAFFCAVAIAAGAFFGCAEFGGAASEPAESASVPVPKTLAEHVEEQVTDLVHSLEDRGMTEEEITALSPATGYLAARVAEYRGFICIPDADGPDGFAYMYDNAAAVIALTAAGAHWYAEKIADAMVYAMYHDRSFADGRLRNAYMAGDPSAEGGWSFVKDKEAVKMAGLWEDDQWQEDYYAVSTSTGNMAWAMLALCHAAQGAEKEEKAAEYTQAAVKAADFVLGLRSGTGGFSGGYEGWDKEQTLLTYKSTEHNIDLISAFSTLAALVREADPARAAEYDEAAEHANKFVLSMYNSGGYFFYTGTQDDGVTISRGVLPLDANTWAILALGDSLADTEQIIDFVEENIAVGDGFDFSAGDLDGIWHEGTAQMAVCYHMLGSTAAYNRVMAYLNAQARPDGSITAADRDNVSTGFFVSGTDVLWEYNRTINLGATNWLAFAQLKMNPLECPPAAEAGAGEDATGEGAASSSVEMESAPAGSRP